MKKKQITKCILHVVAMGLMVAISFPAGAQSAPETPIQKTIWQKLRSPFDRLMARIKENEKKRKEYWASLSPQERAKEKKKQIIVGVTLLALYALLLGGLIGGIVLLPSRYDQYSLETYTEILASVKVRAELVGMQDGDIAFILEQVQMKHKNSSPLEIIKEKYEALNTATQKYSDELQARRDIYRAQQDKELKERDAFIIKAFDRLDQAKRADQEGDSKKAQELWDEYFRWLKFGEQYGLYTPPPSTSVDKQSKDEDEKAESLESLECFYRQDEPPLETGKKSTERSQSDTESEPDVEKLEALKRKLFGESLR